MDPISAIAGGASTVLSTVMGIIGNLAGSGDRDAAEALRQKAMSQYNIKLPDVDSIHSATVGNAFDQVRDDPRLKDAQMSALSQLQDVASSGGLRAQDQARLAQIRSDSDQQERGSREALMNQANARGMGGSSSELQAMLANQQGAAQRASAQDMAVNGQAEQAALDAINGSANMASGVRGQDYSEAAQRAGAANQLGQFNSTQSQNANIFNVGQANQQFQNSMDLAGAKAGQDNSQAGALEGRANATQAAFSAGGQAGGQALTSLAQYTGYQNNKKQQAGYGAP